MIDLKELEERVILAAVSTSETDMAERSLDELKELADTAGAKTVGRVIQNRESVHPGTYLGKGKLQELREMLYETGATGVICDDELSPAQLKNLEDILDTKVMDRTMVILDIFAARANTREGKIQVELAQLKYRAIRLVECVPLFPDWEAVSVQEDLVRKNWKQTAVLFTSALVS